jgi:hypothetical protein
MGHSRQSCQDAGRTLPPSDRRTSHFRTGEMMDVKGKPASFKVKAAAMKGLKDLAGKK